MVKSILTKAKIVLIASPIAFCCAFSYKMGEKEWLDWSNKCLSESFDPSADAKLKNGKLRLLLNILSA